MLYELIGIVRPGRIAEVKEIAKSAGKLVLDSGGVIRGFTNWGVFALPKPRRDTSYTKEATPAAPTPSSATAASGDVPPALAQISLDAQSQLSQSPPAARRHPKHHVGHYFIMRFDSSGRTQHAVRRTMSLDPRLLRYSMVKLGNNLDEIADVGGKAEEWAGFAGSDGQRWTAINADRFRS